MFNARTRVPPALTRWFFICALLAFHRSRPRYWGLFTPCLHPRRGAGWSFCCLHSDWGIMFVRAIGIGIGIGATHRPRAPAWPAMRRACIILALLLAALAARPALAQQAPEQLADQVLLHAHEATAIAEGGGHRVVDIFFDPNCPYCRQLYDDLQPWVGQHGLVQRWIPVAVLSPSSAGKAAAMLQSAAPRRALQHNEDDFGASRRAGAGGALVPAAPVSAATRAELARNLQVLHAAGAYFAFPLMVWRDRAGQAQIFLGAPRDAAQLKALLATVG